MREEVNGRVSKVARRPTPSMQPSWSKLETLQRDTSKVSARPNSILHSSRPTTTTSNCRRRSADIAGDPAPLTSLPASEPELTSRSRPEVPAGVGDPGARRPAAAGRRTRGARSAEVRAVAERRRTVSGRRKKTEERIRRRRRRPAAVSLRSAVARDSPPAATARRPPSAPPRRRLRKRPGRRSNRRRRRKSKPPLVPLGVAAAAAAVRRRGRDPTASTTTTTTTQATTSWWPTRWTGAAAATR